MQKIPGCTSDDINRVYNPLIETSCRAAADNMARNANAGPVLKTNAECQNEIVKCMSARCGANWTDCTDNSAFDQRWSTCLINARCDSATDTASMKTELNAMRTDYFARIDARITSNAATRKSERENRVRTTKTSCENGSAKRNCITNICGNLPNKCANNHASENQMATNLCKFIDIACEQIK
jgi:hypothetical protein